MSKDLVLYYLKSCPYSKKVLKYLDENNIEILMKEIKENKKAKKELIEEGGKEQVPCLFINSEALYESDDIIEWFEKNY